tara:strand:- start:2487 stop:3149 length:663 start_codon:yes stop_codon:yes gene_type:complete
MGDISKLDAVNHMLLMAGESLVPDLDENSGLDTETALFVLDQFVRDFQIRGIANNKLIKKITLDAKGKIVINADAISAELISFHNNNDGYNIIGILKGTGTNKYLWNVTDQSDEWDTNTEYRYELILSLPWEDMDTPVQRAILSSAARQYQLVTQGDGDADNYLKEMEMFYQSKGKAADLDDRRRSVFTAASAKLQAARSRNDYPRSSQALRYWRTSNRG